MATGDKKNAIEKLKHELVSIKFDIEKSWDVEAVACGDPSTYMMFARYAVLGFSRSVSTYLTINNLVVDAQADYAFMSNIFQLLRREFKVNISLSAEQFFQVSPVCACLTHNCKRIEANRLRFFPCVTWSGYI